MKTQIKFLIVSGIFLLGCSTGNDHVGHDTDQPPMEHDMESQAVVMLTAHEQQVANITLDTVKRKRLSKTTMLLGTIAINDKQVDVISARVRGRLDQLFVRNPGESIRKNQPLYAIYSEELLSDENEYLLALTQRQQFLNQQKTTQALLEASRKKLVLWGLTEIQIKELEKTGKTSPLITFYSPVHGALTNLHVSEGQYVEMGSPLFTVSNLSSLWVESQVYPGEVKDVIRYPEVEIELEVFPERRLEGKMVFVNPAFDSNSKINYVRYEIQNQGLPITPGMMAYVYLTNNEKEAVVVPRSAIVFETMPAVWVQIESGVFEKRMVKLGIQNKAEVEIVEGLISGDVVAGTGGYLINSQYILLKGANSMGGMKM